MAIVAAFIAGLLGIGLWLWMAAKTKRGRSWARVTSSVLFGIFTLYLAGNMAQQIPAVNEVAGVVSWLAALGATVCLWRPESSHFFKNMKNPKP